MKQYIPFNAGDLVEADYGSKYIILGHVWWPVEKKNAYYCLPVNEYGEPINDSVQYNWDSQRNWKLFTPKQEAA